MADEYSYHWESKVMCLVAGTATDLAEAINEAYVKRFVVGTQVFPVDDDVWIAFVYFKVRVERLPRRIA